MNKHTVDPGNRPEWYPYCDLDIFVNINYLHTHGTRGDSEFIDLILKYNPKETFIYIQNVDDRETYAKTYSKNPIIRKMAKEHRGWMYRQRNSIGEVSS